MNDFKKDYYKILAISPSATADEVKLAYRKQVKMHHPDLHSDNTASEALIKEINEAYEVLGNTNERFAYDQYLLNKKAQQKEEQASQQYSTNKNKRTYTKTTTVEIEERTYLKGIIFIKYFGKHDERAAENILRETFYKITVRQVNATIEKKNIFERVLPKEFEYFFAKYKPIRLNIKQPISCTITYDNKNPVDYKLEILDLAIPDPRIINVTQHEGESFGTITGVFYGYVKQIKTQDETNVEECFGETGRKEQKNENGVNYHRKEYYNTDCSTFWGNWMKDSGPVTPPPPADRGNKPLRESSIGCAGSFGSIIGIGLSFLLFLFILPQLAFLLPFLVIPFVLNLFPTIWSWVARILFILFGLVFFLSIIAVIFSHLHNNEQEVVIKPKPTIIKPKYTPVTDTLSDKKIIDTLITHHMIWNDYTGNTYEGDYSIKKSTLNQAHSYKENLDISADNENNYDKIIFSLKENDKEHMVGLYAMFDSLKRVNKPSSMAFAEIVVSFVQSIPYTLVLPKACDARFYQDEFTAEYLARPDARCDGYERYGINTPVEFMANLNGDCDTRTLMLYTILSHYDYDVALLSSAHYSHSILGINLPYEGLTYNYNNQRYVLWETTVQSIKPGIISNEISNTDYWRISLKSK